MPRRVEWQDLTGQDLTSMCLIRRQGELRHLFKPATSLRRRFELNSVQSVLRIMPAWPVADRAGCAAQLLNPRHRLLDDSDELFAIFIFPTLSQALNRCLNRKPGTISVGLLRIAEPSHLTEMSADRKGFRG